ncbi:hypothetical protein [Meiothermus granaticius]|uniref:hypothetical protein n=1 Tax=Meiothermus granaticius TaxID=863370 RepID=UPI001194B438|nr:hypothetical protein [Meiothermus granaticius]MCL6526394.1 hypothetical protein [Thermaceae bacterium]GEM86004.1 hypothetical protein MGR01S_06290 [Meiothermus granaticius NBRC 107808]
MSDTWSDHKPRTGLAGLIIGYLKLALKRHPHLNRQVAVAAGVIANPDKNRPARPQVKLI